MVVVFRPVEDQVLEHVLRRDQELEHVLCKDQELEHVLCKDQVLEHVWLVQLEVILVFQEYAVVVVHIVERAYNLLAWHVQTDEEVLVPEEQEDLNLHVL